MKKLTILTLSIMFLLVTPLGTSGALLTGDQVDVPLNDELVATIDYTAKSELVDIDDYTIVDENKLDWGIASSYIDSGDGESALDTGTSYITLEESTVLGDYSSESGSWAERAFLETTYGSVTESVSNQTQSDPALSASSSSAYMTAQGTFSSTSGLTSDQYMSWTADIWSDVDGDGTDDSSTVAAEEYVALTQNVFILVVMKVDASDTDAQAFVTACLGFYTGSTDYDVCVQNRGGDDTANSYVNDWIYTDGTSVGASYDAMLVNYETEDEYTAVLIDLADLISDDTDSSPSISGINDVTLTIQALDGYGDGTADTVTAYISNIAIFNQLPALTDNSLGSGNSVSWHGGDNNAAIGDATHYSKHDILLSYVAAASNNDWDTRIYIENDIAIDQILLTDWHMLSIDGTIRIPPNRSFKDAGGSEVINGITMETEIGDDKQVRKVNLYWDLNYVRPSDKDDYDTSGFAPVLSSFAFAQVLDDNDVYVSSVNSMEEALISAELGSTDKFDTFETSWDSWTASSTEIQIDLWSTDPSDGDNVEIHYSYNTHESGVVVSNLKGNAAASWEYARQNYAMPFAIAAAVLVFVGILPRKED